jgi:RNA polymerase sigma factor (sigma-70 family)
MPEMNDMTLVQEYAERGSEAAFADLVRRHIHLVYSVAFRYAGNSADAQDITQAVFVILVRKAASLRQRTTITGWLYETTRFTAVAFLRTKARQQARDQESYMRSTLNDSGPDEVWPQLAPLLEEAMNRLSEKERELLALRLFENKTAAETAALLGIREEAAHKRMARAVDKLRHFFFRRGITSTPVLIAGAISAHSGQGAPAALAKTVTAMALAKGTTVSGSTLTLVKGALKIMAWTKAQTAIIGAVAVGLATLSVMQQRTQAKMREQNEALTRQIAQLQTDNESLSTRVALAERAPHLPTPHLPAPPTQMTPSTNALLEAWSATNLLDRLKDKNPQLAREQVEAFLKANGRNAANLLAAFRTSGDPALLQEAMQKYPHDPQVAYEAAMDHDLSPAEQRQWLNALEKSAPDNALANYLSALNYFNSGQIDQGVQELSAASGKPVGDYNAERVEDDAEAYLAAGYSMADAKELAASQLLQPQLSQLKQLGMDAVDLANAYSQSGDSTSAKTVLQMAATLGQSYATVSPGEYEIGQLVGIAIEQKALQAMDPNSSYSNTGQTVQDQLNELAQQKTAIDELAHQASTWFPAMSDQDWIIYRDRAAIFGMTDADQWLISKYGQH